MKTAEWWSQAEHDWPDFRKRPAIIRKIQEDAVAEVEKQRDMAVQGRKDFRDSYREEREKVREVESRAERAEKEREAFHKTCGELLQATIEADGTITWSKLECKNCTEVEVKESRYKEALEHIENCNTSAACMKLWAMGALNNKMNLARSLPCAASKQPIQIGEDGRCNCSCADPCPIGRIGSSYRCTEQELDAAGVVTQKKGTTTKECNHWPGQPRCQVCGMGRKSPRECPEPNEPGWEFVPIGCIHDRHSTDTRDWVNQGNTAEVEVWVKCGCLRRKGDTTKGCSAPTVVRHRGCLFHGVDNCAACNAKRRLPK